MRYIKCRNAFTSSSGLLEAAAILGEVPVPAPTELAGFHNKPAYCCSPTSNCQQAHRSDCKRFPFETDECIHGIFQS